ncbi:hypothetical protein K1719_020878 [Acacia pycnantha]|nr:hypothetical protein K1719_020878 [Acacia pycnantha]
MQVLEIQKPPLIDSCFDLRIMGSCNGLLCLEVINENYAMSHRSKNNGSWKAVEFENLERTISINSFGNVILHGVLYGLGGEQSSSVHRDRDMVVSVDLTKHVFTSIPLPDLGSKKSRRVKLMLYENKPAVVAVTISSLVHLWVMEEDTCASRGRWIWTKKYTCSFCAMRFWAMRSPIEFVDYLEE